MTTESYISYKLINGLLGNFSDNEFPTQLRSWNGGWLSLPNTGTHYGYVWQDEPILMTETSTFTLQSGMYFSIPGAAKLIGSGKGIAITRLGYQGTFSIGGPIERNGRLRYIDGCMDSLIIPPPLLGDPCLNALYFPSGISQTPHFHPSMRIGMVASGEGMCVTPSNEDIPLASGQVFMIPAGAVHSFKTTNTPMVIVAYHPDSDCGPTHESHPLLTRTWVNGVPASQLEEIRTSA